MAHEYVTNSGATRLPPIRRKYGSVDNSEFKNFGRETLALPSTLPRLPRIENRQVTATRWTYIDQQQRQGHQKSLCFTIDGNFPPLRLAAKKLRNPFERSSTFGGLNGGEETLMGSRVHEADRIHLDGKISKDGTLKPKANDENARPFLRPEHLFRRRLRPSKAYQQGDSHMSHRELLALDQNMDHLRAFTERDKVIEVRDFNGKKIDPNKTGNHDITSCIAMFEDVKGTDKNISNGNNNGASTTKAAQDNEMSSESEETKMRVRGRFYEALDLHYYHYYRNTHPQRRMAICEEIERGIVVDNITLSWYRENLRLQDVLNTWML